MPQFAEGLPEAFLKLLQQACFGSDSSTEGSKQLANLWEIIAGSRVTYLNLPAPMLACLDKLPHLKGLAPLRFVARLMPTLHQGYLEAMYDDYQASNQHISFLTYIQRNYILSDDKQFLLHVPDVLQRLKSDNHLRPRCELLDINTQVCCDRPYTPGELARIENFSDYTKGFFTQAKVAHASLYRQTSLLTILELLLKKLNAARSGIHGGAYEFDASREINEFLPVFQVIWDNLSSDHQRYLLTFHGRRFHVILNGLSPSIVQSVSDTKLKWSARTCLDTHAVGLKAIIKEYRGKLAKQQLDEIHVINAALHAAGFDDYIFKEERKKPALAGGENTEVCFPTFDVKAFTHSPPKQESYISASDEVGCWAAFKRVEGLSEEASQGLAHSMNHFLSYLADAEPAADLVALLPRLSEADAEVIHKRICETKRKSLSDFQQILDACYRLFPDLRQKYSDDNIAVFIEYFDLHARELAAVKETIFDSVYPYRQSESDPHWTVFLGLLPADARTKLLKAIRNKRQARPRNGEDADLSRGGYSVLVKNWHDLLRLSCYVDIPEHVIEDLKQAGILVLDFDLHVHVQVPQIMNDEAFEPDKNSLWNNFLDAAMPAMADLVVMAKKMTSEPGDNESAAERYEAAISQLTAPGFTRFLQACMKRPEATGLFPKVGTVVNPANPTCYRCAGAFVSRLKPEHLDIAGVSEMLMKSVESWQCGLVTQAVSSVTSYYDRLFGLLISRPGKTQSLFKSMLTDLTSNTWRHVLSIINMCRPGLPNLGVLGKIFNGLLSAAEGDTGEVWRVMHYAFNDFMPRSPLYKASRELLYYWYLREALGQYIATAEPEALDEHICKKSFASQPARSALHMIRTVTYVISDLRALEVALELLKRAPEGHRVSLINVLSRHLEIDFVAHTQETINMAYQIMFLFDSVVDQACCIQALFKRGVFDWFRMPVPGPFADSFHLSEVYDQYYRAQSVMMCQMLSACLKKIDAADMSKEQGVAADIWRSQPYIRVVWRNVDPDVREHFSDVQHWLEQDVSIQAGRCQHDLLRLFPLLWPRDHLARLKLMTPEIDQVAFPQEREVLLASTFRRIHADYAAQYIVGMDALRQFLKDCSVILPFLCERYSDDIRDMIVNRVRAYCQKMVCESVNASGVDVDNGVLLFCQYLRGTLNINHDAAGRRVYYSIVAQLLFFYAHVLFPNQADFEAVLADQLMKKSDSETLAVRAESIALHDFEKRCADENLPWIVDVCMFLTAFAETPLQEVELSNLSRLCDRAMALPGGEKTTKLIFLVDRIGGMIAWFKVAKQKDSLADYHRMISVQQPWVGMMETLMKRWITNDAATVEMVDAMASQIEEMLEKRYQIAGMTDVCLNFFRQAIQVDPQASRKDFPFHRFVILNCLLRDPPDNITDKLIAMFREVVPRDVSYGMTVLLLSCKLSVMRKEFNVDTIDWLQLCSQEPILSALGKYQLSIAYDYLGEESQYLTQPAKASIAYLLMYWIFVSLNHKMQRVQLQTVDYLRYAKMINRIITLPGFMCMEDVLEDVSDTYHREVRLEHEIGTLLDADPDTPIFYALFLASRCEAAMSSESPQTGT